MAIPWALKPSSKNVVADYHQWVKTHYKLHNRNPCLCNWFPLRILVEFAAEHGVRLKLIYWPGSASTTGGRRAWNTKKELVHDSHGGKFNSKIAYRRKVESTVTARMIGTLNTSAILKAEARVGDLLLRDLTASFWHIELITDITGNVITTEAGSTPAVVPKNHKEVYGDTLTDGRKLYENKPRRWDFTSICSGA
ncbi:MAG: hypothetical protein OQL06_08185 [Gammaproteobacteria bacterium]|nr:hypothetical protein [Gammaproteobacteria bacterium]